MLGPDAPQRGRVLELLSALVIQGKYVWDSFVELDDITVDQLTVRLRDIAAKRKLTGSWLTKHSLTAFLSAQLRMMLGDYHSDILGKRLIHIAALADVEATAARLYEALSSLPWTYRFIAPLPVEACRTCGPVDIALGDALHVKHAESEQPPVFTGRAHERHLYEQLFLVGEMCGYLPETGPSGSIEEFLNAWKGLLGLQVVEEAVNVRWYVYGLPEHAVAIEILRVDETGAMQFLKRQALSVEDGALYNRLSGADWRLHSEAVDAVRKVVPAFQYVPARTAARWYLDSAGEAEGALQIVQVAVSLETLLGDKNESDDMGVTALLANRLAYLVGQNPAERQKILFDIRRLYKLRSHVVHAGKFALSDDERSALHELRRYARRALHQYVRAFGAIPTIHLLSRANGSHAELRGQGLVCRSRCGRQVAAYTAGQRHAICNLHDAAALGFGPGDSAALALS